MFRGNLLTVAFLAVGCALAQEAQPPMFICSEAHPRTAGPCINPPKVIYQPEPTYSEEANRARLEGMVRLRLVITPEGRPEDIQVTRSLGMGLDEKAKEAVSRWRFAPATIDGKPVALKTNIEINFRLKDEAVKEPVESTASDEIPDTEGSGSSEASQFYRSGVAAFRAKDYEAAATAWKRTVELDPGNLYAWSQLCRADYELKKIEAAVVACRKQIAITPDHKYAHNNLARALWAQGKLDEAEQEFRKQITINPQDRWAHANLGLLLRKEHRCDAAIPELETGINIDANNVKAREGLRDCYLTTEQSDKAERLTAPERDFFSPEIGLKVHLPQGWTVAGESQPSLAVPAQVVLLKIGSMATLVLQHEHMEFSPETFFALAKERLAKSPDFQLISEDAVSLDGADGNRLVFKYTSDKMATKGWMEIFSHGGEHYRVTARAPTDMFDRYAPVFASMLESVRFAWRHPDEKFASTVVPAGVIGGIVSSTPASHPKTATPQRVRISAGAAAMLLIKKVQPVYPPVAKSARIQGPVVLEAVISPAGEVTDLKVISGHPMLVAAALDTAKQCKYRPYYLNGSPVEVETQIQIDFVLGN